MRLSFTIDGNEFPAELLDVDASKDIAAMCPMELDLERSMDREYFASLPEKVSVEGCEETSKAKRNGIYIFESWNSLALVIEDCDISPYKIHHIGTFEKDYASFSENKGTNQRIRIERID